MKIALLQLNLTVGDLEGNVELILGGVQKAAESGARLCITSELALTGYPARDLLLNADFVSRCREAVSEISRRMPEGVALLAGELISIMKVSVILCATLHGLSNMGKFPMFFTSGCCRPTMFLTSNAISSLLKT